MVVQRQRKHMNAQSEHHEASFLNEHQCRSEAASTEEGQDPALAQSPVEKAMSALNRVDPEASKWKKSSVKKKKDDLVLQKNQRRAIRIATTVDTSLLRQPSFDSMMQSFNAQRTKGNGAQRSLGTLLLATELACITSLKVSFADALGKTLGHRWPSVLEQWLASSSPVDTTQASFQATYSSSSPAASILPIGAHMQDVLAKILADDWHVNTNEANEQARSLEQEARRLHDVYIASCNRSEDTGVAIKSNVPAGKLCARKTVMRCPTVTGMYVTIKMKDAYWTKLRALHALGNPGRRMSSVKADGFAAAARELACIGGHEGRVAGGCHAALPPEVLDVMCEHFGPSEVCEAFATPVNAYLHRFCSRFAAVDTPFGSLGSFFDITASKLLPGSSAIVANPPFIHDLIQRTVSHCEHLLHSAGTHALSIVLIVPYKPQRSSGVYNALHSSFYRNHLQLAPKQHVYQEGTAMMKKLRFRPAATESAVIFLQNNAAHEQYAPSQELFHKVRQGFGLRSRRFGA